MVQLSQGEYERANQLVGDEYDDLLSKYVDVAGETAEADTEVAKSLNETATQQRSYTELLAEYQSLYKEYQTAIDAGDEPRARELARQLQQLAAQIDGVTANLTASYNSLSEMTGADLEDATTSVGETTDQVSTEVEDVVEAEFTTTSVSATATAGGFNDPLRVTGQLNTPDSRVPSSPVTIRVGGQRFQTDLNASGGFTINYRPVTVTSGPQQLPIEFVPANESALLGSRTTTAATVEPIKPSLSVASTPTTVGYGDRIPVRGRVVSDGVGVPDTPVAVQVGGSTLVAIRTNATGGYTTSATLPANIPVNVSTMTVVAGENGTAITPASERRTVQVNETATTVSVDVEESAKSVLLSGQLRTEERKPIAARSVAVSVNGVAVETVRTDASGHYSARVQASELGNGSASVNIAFDGSGLNLESASVSVIVDGSTGGSPGFISGSRLPPWWLLLAFAGSIVGLGYASRQYLQDGHTESVDDDDNARAPSGKHEPKPDQSQIVVQDQLSTAQAKLTEGDSETAIRLAYPALRASISQQESDAQTNWEFYRSVVDEVNSETASTIRAVTETYEEAVYAGSSPGVDDARSVVEAVREIAEDSDRVAYPNGLRTSN
ncbi:DUF4129 domain-containing protein [Halobacterium salinarum]|uniref:DUF4129 domain-containing protein n=1 Tax=Halobacterium salinarum TaxID=2242 RepID=UPI0025572089|nr:DUF4129 domain-containing protein [Halobacterium salinarum]MDL0119419.1 DUF4129 domain-containing protein [Halobacterium salinarum]